MSLSHACIKEARGRDTEVCGYFHCVIYQFIVTECRSVTAQAQGSSEGD